MARSRKSPESISSFPFATHKKKRAKTNSNSAAAIQELVNGSRDDGRLDDGAPIYAEVFFFDAAELVPWPGLNPRRHFDEAKFAELVANVREFGILQPILVHDTGTEPRWVVCGETRWRAAKEAGVRVPAIVRQLTHEQALEIALIENLHRSDLTPVEEARGFRALLDAGGRTQKQLAEKIGRSQPYIANRVRLLELPEEALGLVEEGLIDPTAARDLLLPFARIPQKKREQLYSGVAKRIREDKRGLSADLIRRIVGDVARDLSHSLTKSEWDKGAPVFNVALHDKCTCGGPDYEYGWRKERRCFDDAWWNEQQHKAKSVAGARKEAAIEKALEKADQVAGKPVLSEKSFHAKYEIGKYHELAVGRRPVTHLDPTLLPAESLLFVDQYRGRTLVCTDMAAVKKAQKAAEEEREQLLEERKRERADRERAEAEGTSVVPWMLRTFLKEDVGVLGILPDVAAEQGMPFDDDQDSDDQLDKLSNEEVTRLFKILALRARASTDRWHRDPIRDEVNEILEQKYAPLIQALLPPAPLRPGVSVEVSREIDRRLLQLEDLEEEAELRAALAEWDKFVAGLPQIHWGPKGALDGPEWEIIDDARARLEDFREDGAGDGAGDLDYKCVVCSCTDSHACEGGCSWLVRDAGRRVGVCSACAKNHAQANRILNDSYDAVPA